MYLTRYAGYLLLAQLLLSCTININVYDHRSGVGQISDNPQAPTRPNVTTRPTVPQTPSARYSELFITSTPALANIRMLSDGVASTDIVLGTTPLTLRLEPGVSSPFGSGSCGRTLQFLIEKSGFANQIVERVLECFSTEEEMERSPVEIRVALNALN